MLVQVFTEVFSREHQLMKVDPRKSTYLACCLLMRGKMSIADMNRNVTRLKPNLRMVHWNSDGFKLGICSTPPVGMGPGACCGTPCVQVWSLVTALAAAGLCLGSCLGFTNCT